MLRQLFFGGVIGLANIAIHALAPPPDVGLTWRPATALRRERAGRN